MDTGITRTLQCLKPWEKRWQNLNLIHLLPNFGHQNWAGGWTALSFVVNFPMAQVLDLEGTCYPSSHPIGKTFHLPNLNYIVSVSSTNHQAIRYWCFGEAELRM